MRIVPHLGNTKRHMYVKYNMSVMLEILTGETATGCIPTRDGLKFQYQMKPYN